MEVNAVEDEGHGELGEDKTQLMQKKRKRYARLSGKQYDINKIINEGKTHIENDVKDRLEDDDIAVARSLWELLLLLHVLLLIVDAFIVLLCHPAHM